MIGYGDRARTQCEVVRLFRETHPDLPPLNQGTISKIEAQYREMGHVRKVPSKRQAVVDDTKLNLLLALEENPITPARQLARDNLTSNLFLKSNTFKLEKLPPTEEAAAQHSYRVYYQLQTWLDLSDSEDIDEEPAKNNDIEIEEPENANDFEDNIEFESLIDEENEPQQKRPKKFTCAEVKATPTGIQVARMAIERA
ncbi:hypothetical protein NQ318_014107 [Aromia moschata]|uniref:DUF4817 domain-containing protein n=1 Tax=Aromia moschata TaxID=1265417 RepID=A0AAV8Z0B1_9CUCU|nr:hypothetical protein NQ318_014107 [Aromia moschata]